MASVNNNGVCSLHRLANLALLVWWLWLCVVRYRVGAFWKALATPQVKQCQCCFDGEWHSHQSPSMVPMMFRWGMTFASITFCVCGSVLPLGLVTAQSPKISVVVKRGCKDSKMPPGLPLVSSSSTSTSSPPPPQVHLESTFNSISSPTPPPH